MVLLVNGFGAMNNARMNGLAYLDVEMEAVAMLGLVIAAAALTAELTAELTAGRKSRENMAFEC